MNLFTFIAAFLTGIVASMGLGGGMVLILYLSIFTTTPQATAQGINLLFFIPIAVIALIIHTKNKLVMWKKIIPSLITGVVGAVIGWILADYFSSDMLMKIFAFFVIIIGLKEVFVRKKDTE